MPTLLKVFSDPFTRTSVACGDLVLELTKEIADEFF